MSKEMRPKDYMELGILYVREGRYDAAFRALRQAMFGYTEERGHELPYPLMSYYGLCLVVLRQDPPRGLAMCKRAVDEAGNRPEFYWALGKAYLAMRRKPQAITAFQHGLQIGDDARLVGELRRLGIRNEPLIPFLSRENFLNRYLGILRAKSRAA
jgi:tetratricopeptide (TPR) repeat protein